MGEIPLGLIMKIANTLLKLCDEFEKFLDKESECSECVGLTVLISNNKAVKLAQENQKQLKKVLMECRPKEVNDVD